MSIRTPGFGGALVALLLYAAPLEAKTVVVGDPACQPTLEHYATIQAAINAVKTLDGSTVLVCPGVYPEQIVISSPLTIKGVDTTDGSNVVIAVPAAGLGVNATTPAYGPVAAQVVVTNTGPVKILNLTVDGTGMTCASAIGATRSVGIQLLNDAADTIQNVVVRNQRDGCGTGQGIASEFTAVTIDSSNIHDVEGDCISQTGDKNIVVTGNVISGCSATGIALYGVTHGTISGNLISFTGAGVMLAGGTRDTNVQKNTLGPWAGLALYVYQSSNNAVTANIVFKSYFGIELNQARAVTVKDNTLSSMEGFGVGDAYSLGDNKVVNNTMNEVPYAFWLIAPANDALAPNALFNVNSTFYASFAALMMYYPY